MTQFTASEVRELAATTWPDFVAETLNAFADLLEAREKAVPVGCLTVQRFRGSDAMVNHDFDYYGSLPDGSYSLYTQSQSAPSDSKRLAEALHSIGERLSSVLCDPFGEVVVRGSDGDQQVLTQALKDLGELAAHSAQAQPPAASVTDAQRVFTPKEEIGMYSLASIQYARDNANQGDDWDTFLADLEEYEAVHAEKVPGLFSQMGIGPDPVFPYLENRARELETLTKPVADWLADKWNPHATVVITSERAEVVCGELAVIHEAALAAQENPNG